MMQSVFGLHEKFEDDNVALYELWVYTLVHQAGAKVINTLRETR